MHIQDNWCILGTLSDTKCCDYENPEALAPGAKISRCQAPGAPWEVPGGLWWSLGLPWELLGGSLTRFVM